jgi:hypothetical protein
VIRCDSMRFDEWFDSILSDLILCWQKRCDSIRFDSIRFDSIRFDSILGVGDSILV